MPCTISRVCRWQTFYAMKITEGQKAYRLRGHEQVVNKLDLLGVTYHEDAVAFDNKHWNPSTVKLASAAITGRPVNLSTVQFAPANLKTFEPGKKELELIRARARNSSIQLEDVFVFERFPVNNTLSRSGFLQFTDRAIEKLAADFNAGRSRLMYHVERQVVGMTIFAEAVNEEVQGVKGRFVRTVEYMMRTDRTKDLITEIQGGIFPFDSIGVSLGNKVELIEQDEHRFLLVDFDQEDTVSPVEGHEVSFVHLGEIRGAGRKMGVEDSPLTPDQQKALEEGKLVFSVEDSPGLVEITKEHVGEEIPMATLKTVSHRLNATKEVVKLEVPENFRDEDYFRKLEAEIDAVRSELRAQLSAAESAHSREMQKVEAEHAKLKSAVAGRIVLLEKQSSDDPAKYDDQKELDYYTGLSSDRLAAALDHAQSASENMSRTALGAGRGGSLFSTPVPTGGAN